MRPPLHFLLLSPLLPLPATAEIVGTWTIDRLRRDCSDDGASCVYDFFFNVDYYTNPPSGGDKYSYDPDHETKNIINRNHINHNNNSSSAPPPLTRCIITIHRPPFPGGDDGQITANANQTDVADEPCRDPNDEEEEEEEEENEEDEGYGDGEGQGGARYRVSGGWNATGFMTIVPTDEGRDAYAFFGYRDSEMAGGREVGPKSRPAYRVGTFSAAAAASGGGGCGGGGGGGGGGAGSGGDVGDGGGGGDDEGGGEEVEEGRREEAEGNGKRREVGYQAGEKEKKEDIDRETRKRVDEEQRTWQIQDLSLFFDEPLNATNVKMMIVDSELGATECRLVVRSHKSLESWYAKSCGEFTISWGYNNDTGSAVMTVCRPANGTVAWFGFENVDSITSFPDSKHEPVYHMGCA